MNTQAGQVEGTEPVMPAGSRGRARRAVLGFSAAAILAGLTGCAETDAWLMDPSVVGRWEWTPTTVPILTRITSIEGPEDEFVEVSDPVASDLIPEVFEYRIGPGDRMLVEIWDIPAEGQVARYERIVDARGFITVPQLGPIFVAGHTVSGAEEILMDAMRAADLVFDPLVSIIVDHQRQLRYSVVGAVNAPGPYVIPAADYRLHEALAAAGGFSEAPAFLYVIRFIPLEEAVGARPVPVRPHDPEVDPTVPAPDRLIDIIEELARPDGEPQPREPEQDEPDSPGGSPGLMRPRPLQPEQPPIDLIEDPRSPTRQAAPPDAPATSWVHVEGRWVQVQPRTTTNDVPPIEEALGLPAPDSPLVTQRVIRIPVKRLTAGDQRVNIVIRPGDIVRVPPPPPGNIYVLGQVNRVGSYAMAEQLTLRRIISAAGGFNALAIPERIDLTRMVGPDRQATIRLNGRAIFHGTHPDIFLKANDEVNVGTSFWATPMAVIRNGFRATYGFGFLLDRNFGNDVFGPPPTRVVGQ